MIVFPLALGWHLGLFEETYQAFGYFEGEPNDEAVPKPSRLRVNYACARCLARVARYFASLESQKLTVPPSTLSRRRAVSSVIDALPLMSRLTCLAVYPVRSANSVCGQPRSSRRSRMVSPGGDTPFGSN